MQQLEQIFPAVELNIMWGKLNFKVLRKVHIFVKNEELEAPTALCIKGVNLRKKSEICGRSLYLCGLNVLFAAYHRHKLW